MKNESRISVRTLTAMALLIAMSIVFSRVLSISTGFVRFNLGSLPVLLAGILFGPWAGFVVGMVADIIGGVLAGYAINPLITLGAASIGPGRRPGLAEAFPSAHRQPAVVQCAGGTLRRLDGH